MDNQKYSQKHIVVFYHFLSILYLLAIYERIAAYQSPPPKKTRPNFMMRNPTFCMLPYHWMILSVIMLTLYCIDVQSEIMSLDFQFRNAYWFIIKNIENYIFPMESKLPPERYKKHPCIHVCNNPKRRK